jgi:hypothetical protein
MEMMRVRWRARGQEGMRERDRVDEETVQREEGVRRDDGDRSRKAEEQAMKVEGMWWYMMLGVRPCSLR